MTMRSILLLFLVTILVACGGKAASGPRAAPPAHPPPRPVTTSATTAGPPAPVQLDQSATELNLGFEASIGEHPEAWSWDLGNKAYEVSLDRDAHGGSASLRLRAVGIGESGWASVFTDATRLRGKRVRLHGWVKTDAVDSKAGWAGFWISARGGAQIAAENMRNSGFTGSADWRTGSVQIDVPLDAVRIVFGPRLVGPGTAWFDDLRLEIIELPPAKPIHLAGAVLDPSGLPVAGATVTLVNAAGNVETFVVTDDKGMYRIDTRTGTWGISAHHPSGVGAFFDPREITKDTTLDFSLATSGVRVHGRLIASAPLPAGLHVRVSPYSDHYGDIFMVPVGADGRFEARLPHGTTYQATTISKDVAAEGTANVKDDEVELTLKASVLAPPPEDVKAWIVASGVPLRSPEPGQGFEDMKAISAMIGKARIVALGEASHGTREFFQIKHRFLEYLVTKHGFTTFIIEANLTECRAINDYVLHGKGDPKKALDGIYFWIWNTEEVLAMIEWMRAWNADPKHTKKVSFHGDDVQFTAVAHRNVVEILKKVAPAEVDALVAPLAAFASDKDGEGIRAAPAAEQQNAQAALDALAKRFDASRRAWSKQLGKDAYLDGREDLRLLAQALTLAMSGSGRYEARDLAMADNVDHILARLPKETRAVLWAHNGHVAFFDSGLKSQGRTLRERHGKDYVVFGFAFGDGSFQVRDHSKTKETAVTAVTLGAPQVGDVSAPFRAAGKPVIVVDLRKAPRGVVADWFASPHPMRETGSVFTSDDAMSYPQEVSNRYDALIYVDKTTASRPNPGGVRR
jgi:erythromycin esterase